MYDSFVPKPRLNKYQQDHGAEQKQYLQQRSNFYKPHESFTAKYWCETCDRDFRTFQILENHKQQHQKCNIDGCQFIAHPKVITKHIQMQHSSGLFKKIAKLANPEEIQKWREERRNKYPTKKNVFNKNAQIQDKIKRGEKMGLLSNKNQSNSKPDLKRSYNKTGKRNIRNQSLRHCSIHPHKIHKLLGELITRDKLKPFRGLQDLVDSDSEESVMETNLDIVYEETDTTELNVEVFKQPALCGALNSLINEYGSSDDNLDETMTNIDKEPHEKKHETQNIMQKDITELKSITKVINGVTNGKNIEDTDSEPEEVATVRDTNIYNTVEKSNSLKINKQKKLQAKKIKPKINRHNKTRHPSTLLEKLLQKEVQHERNIILQCIRHVVSNKHFDK